MEHIMRCRSCRWFDWEFITEEITPQVEGEHFCGLHGRTRVDPDGPQVDLNHYGGCGYFKIEGGEQLNLNLL